MKILLVASIICLFVFGAKGAEANDGGAEVAPEDENEWLRDGSCTIFPDSDEPVPNDLTSWDSRFDLWVWRDEHPEASVADLKWDLSPSWMKRIEEGFTWMNCQEWQNIPEEFEKLSRFNSQYQEIDVFYSEKEDDVCLILDRFLHTCASLRPHYHEIFVHYPARFLDEVNRVIFIGGGDSMMLHEILKYPSLELVVGLELDQSVTREVFKGFGIQPHWDNDKVEWWYGDAAKTLRLLPRDYYGSFDLVVVDITTEVQEALMVNHELNIMDAALLLMKPGGVISKNEDDPYFPGTQSNYTDYSVDLIYHAVPRYCMQTVIVGSNTVDFLTAKPKDHNVETLYLEGIDDFQAQFDSWYNFGVESSRSITGCQPQHDDKPAPDGDVESLGVLVILEAENTTVSLESATTVKRSIIQALSNVGLFVTTSMSFPISGDIKGFTSVLLFREGYIVSRCFDMLDYCAFDIQLWGSSISKLELVKAGLVGAVQSQHPSSYRMITGGMTGGLDEEKERLGPPAARELCNSKTEGDQKTHSPTKVRREKRAEDFAPQASNLHAYNLTSPLAQFESQRPIGVQTLMQFEVPPLMVDEKVSRPIEDEISFFLAETLQKINGSEPLNLTELSEDKGDGLRIALGWSEGGVIATWDGKTRVELNLFLAFEHNDFPSEVFHKVQRKNLENWRLVRREDFPRGIGSVVNFKTDIKSRPVWAKEQK